MNVSMEIENLEEFHVFCEFFLGPPRKKLGNFIASFGGSDCVNLTP